MANTWAYVPRARGPRPTRPLAPRRLHQRTAERVQALASCAGWRCNYAGVTTRLSSHAVRTVRMSHLPRLGPRTAFSTDPEEVNAAQLGLP